MAEKQTLDTLFPRRRLFALYAYSISSGSRGADDVCARQPKGADLKRSFRLDICGDIDLYRFGGADGA